MFLLCSNEEASVFSCEDCGQEYSSYSSYAAHFVQAGCQGIPQRPDGRYSCHHCLATITTRSGLKNHISSAVRHHSREKPKKFFLFTIIMVYYQRFRKQKIIFLFQILSRKFTFSTALKFQPGKYLRFAKIAIYLFK